MSIGVAATFRIKASAIPAWLLALLLLGGTSIFVGSLGELSRALFVISCGLIGWYAWRQGPAAHLQTALTLFAFAPFVRRVVDLSIGYDPLGLMLVGPLLTILVPSKSLFRSVEWHGVPTYRLYPLLMVGGCIGYATLLTVLQGDWTNAASGTLKWSAPLLYAAVLMLCSDPEEMVTAATSAFLIILPVMGLYGIFQYVDPPDWDRYWMQSAPILSAGQPVPDAVRTFSTMNSPASFATFTAIGLMLVFFSRKAWQLLFLLIPAGIALMLSLYRTAWLSLALGLVFCLLSSVTRKRAGIILLGICALVLLAAIFSPFGEVIADRLATLSDGSDDGSAQERLEQFFTLYNTWDSSLFGVGFTTSDVGSAGAMPVDGMLIACWLSMGIVFGALCVTGLLWAIANAMSSGFRARKNEFIMTGALGAGALVQLPLANITAGENGFLFWTFIVLMAPQLSRKS